MRVAAVLAVSFLVSGCATLFNTFPFLLVNESGGNREIRLDLGPDPSLEPGRSVGSYARNYTLLTASNLTETWRIPSGRYTLTVSSQGVPLVTTELYVCAMYSLRVTVQENEALVKVQRGDGFTGC